MTYFSILMALPPLLTIGFHPLRAAAQETTRSTTTTGEEKPRSGRPGNVDTERPEAIQKRLTDKVDRIKKGARSGPMRDVTRT